jgi:hypothetical protein
MLSVRCPQQAQALVVSLCSVAAARQPVFGKSPWGAATVRNFTSQTGLQPFSEKGRQLSFS